ARTSLMIRVTSGDLSSAHCAGLPRDNLSSKPRPALHDWFMAASYWNFCFGKNTIRGYIRMQQRLLRKTVSLAAACALMVRSALQTAQACTGIRLIAADGSVVYARTLEFGLDLKSEIIMVPRGYARTGTTPDGNEGLKWTSKYASVGMNGAGLHDLFDGLNEK